MHRQHSLLPGRILAELQERPVSLLRFSLLKLGKLLVSMRNPPLKIKIDALPLPRASYISDSAHSRPCSKSGLLTAANVF